jgi:Flp pilus assembly secretin CpaC
MMSVRKRARGVVMGLAATVAIAAAAEAAEPVRLYVTVDKAELVNLPAMPISKLAVTNPGIADVYVVNPTQVLLSGKQAGTTSLTVFHRGGIESFEVVVHPGPVGNSRARLVPSESHAVEVQRAGKVSQQLFVRDEERAWVQLGNGGKAEPEASAK